MNLGFTAKLWLFVIAPLFVGGLGIGANDLVLETARRKAKEKEIETVIALLEDPEKRAIEKAEEHVKCTIYYQNIRADYRKYGSIPFHTFINDRILNSYDKPYICE